MCAVNFLTTDDWSAGQVFFAIRDVFEGREECLSGVLLVLVIFKWGLSVFLFLPPLLVHRN
jgi:hypothetical protein